MKKYLCLYNAFCIKVQISSINIDINMDITEAFIVITCLAYVFHTVNVLEYLFFDVPLINKI